VEASFSLSQDVISWRKSKTTGKTFRKKVVVMQFAWANYGELAGNAPVLDTTNTDNNLEMKREVEKKTLCRMANIHDCLEVWHGTQNLHATPKKSRTHNKQLTAVGYISDTKEIVKASRSNFQHDGVAAFTLSKRSPVPSALSAKDISRRQTQVLNLCWIQQIGRHPAASDDDRVPDSISDTEDWLDCHGDWDTLKDSEHDWEVDNESEIDLDNSIRNLENPEQRDVSAAPNVPRLIQPSQRSKKHAEQLLIMVSTKETRRNKGIKKKEDRISEYIFTRFFM